MNVPPAVTASRGCGMFGISSLGGTVLSSSVCQVQGTTSSGQALITFKPGAFLPGVAVQPVAITIPDYMIWTWDSPGAKQSRWYNKFI